MKRLSALACVVLPATLVVGCFPTDVRWLPDSSGFLRSTSDHKLVLHDMSSGEDRVIAEYDWLEPGMGHPGVNAAMNRFALGRAVVAANETEGEVTLVVVDDEGKELVQETFPWSTTLAKGDPRDMGLWIDWASDDRHLLVSDLEGGIGVFNLETKKLQNWADLELPWVLELMHFGESLVTPEGDGFIAVGKTTANEPTVYHVAWDGTRTELKGIDEIRKEFEDSGDEDAPRVCLLKWTDGKLVYAIPNDARCVAIDPKVKTITVVEDEQATKLFKIAKEHDATLIPFNDDAVILYTAIPDTMNSKDKQRVDLLRLTDGEIKTLVEETPLPICLRSPDRGKMMIWNIDADDDRKSATKLRIIDSTGRTLAEIVHSADN